MMAERPAERRAMNTHEIDDAQRFAQVVALIVRSVELGNEERWVEALACLDEAVAIDPLLPIGRVNRARVLGELERFDEALDGYDSLLRCADPSPEIVVLRQMMIDGAFAVLGRRLDQRPDDPASLLQRGKLYWRTGDLPQALADYSAIVERDGDQVDALNGQGGVLFALDRYAEAIASYRQATASAPQRAELWFNLGNVWQALGRLDEARAAYRQAIELAPQFAEAHLEIGLCHLSEADYSTGWPYYEWRWRSGQMRDDRLPTRQPLWLGGRRPSGLQCDWPDADRLAGKTLLVWAEQGAGDTLQFVRFVPRLLALAGQVILRVQSPLRRLVARLDRRIVVVGDDQELPDHDAHCPLLSLPLALGCAPSVEAPYLHADADEIARWSERLGERQRRRVGLVWAGLQHGPSNPSRDVPAAALAPLAALPLDWISLQLPPADAPARQALPGLRCYAEWLDDYAATAALIMNLDLVIAVDTSVAHLAAALGKPCWLILRFSGEWRWLRGRDDSPWYPTLRIFRQSTPGDWSGVIARVVDALRADELGTAPTASTTLRTGVRG